MYVYNNILDSRNNQECRNIICSLVTLCCLSTQNSIIKLPKILPIELTHISKNRLNLNLKVKNNRIKIM